MGVLTLNAYQAKAIGTDRTKGSGIGIDLAILGLFGEIGGLLSEVKKKQRDSLFYLGYEESVLEEMGDTLWYLAVIANHVSLSLTEVSYSFKCRPAGSAQMVNDRAFADLQPQQILKFAAPTFAFERTLLNLAGAAGRLAASSNDASIGASSVGHHLSDILATLILAANEAGVTLEAAAHNNIEKINSRWPGDRNFPKLFDDDFPVEEQLPRELVVDFYERRAANEKYYVVQRCNGLLIGDRLTDNIMKEDDYRFHDVFHYAYAAVLGWSPVTRALFKLKRKSQTRVDEGQDGARAIVVEEGVATYVFGRAKKLDFFNNLRGGDLSFTLLKSIKDFVQGYEPDQCPLWLWEETILQGSRAFRFLREHRRGRIHLNLLSRSLVISELPA